MQLSKAELNEILISQGLSPLPAIVPQFASLHDLPASFWEQAISLKSPTMAMEYLSNFLPWQVWSEIKPAVLEKWQAHKLTVPDKGGLWTFCPSMKEILTLTIMQMLSPFDSAIHYVITPGRSRWDQGNPFSGAPVFAAMSGMVEYTLTRNFLPLLGTPDLTMVSWEHPEIWMRRWIAQTISLQFHQNIKTGIELEMDQLYAIAPRSQWTPDAHKAIAGLNRELQEGLINLETTVPGYGGPDEWYE